MWWWYHCRVSRERSPWTSTTLKGKMKRCVLSGTGRHTRAGQAHARMDTRGGDTVELREGDKPWAALMIPHGGGNTQRDNGFIKPHTRRIPRNIPKGAKRTMSAYTPCALRFYTLVLRLTAVTLTHASGEARHSHEEGREESALAQVLFNSRVSCHRCEGLWRH